MAKATKTGDAKRVVGYLRVSTEEQTLGPEAQRAALERWCAANGAELVAVLVDQGVSGGAALDKRPGLLAALAALRGHGAGVLLVAKRDRLARDVVLAATADKLAALAGAVVRAADGAGDGEGPEATFVRRIMDANAELERGVIAARTRAALAVKRGRLELVGSVPYGYRLAADGVRLEEDADEQRAVALVHQYRAEGFTLRAIGARLEAQGILPRSGRRWHPQTVARVAAAALAA